MKKYTVLLFILAPALLSGRGVSAPPTLEELPRRPIDTLTTADNSAKVILYTNNTWDYYYPNKAELLDNDVFSDHWVTSQVFAYSDVSLASLPHNIELNLVNGLDEYHAPIVGKVFSKYGPRRRGNHLGVDIPLKTGEPIYAAFGGKVRYAQMNYGGFGNLVIIRHENGLETWYAHLTRCNVSVNDYVTAGTVIGFGGNTGDSRGPHLHFEVRYKDHNFDPERLIEFATGDLLYTTFALEKSYFSIHSHASDKLEEDNFDEKVLAAGSTGELTSEQILSNIESNTKAEADKAAAEAAPKYHTIKSGDNLGKIASLYGTTVSNLCKLNKITATTVINAGKQLRVR
jgi:LysM repeat protein